MNNKVKGFTLIELLAVIVVLAVIAIIVTPIVTGIIRKAKDIADLRSAEKYGEAATLYVAESQNDKSMKSNMNKNIINELNVTGTKATDGAVIFNISGNTAFAIVINDKCYRKDYNASITDIMVDTDLDTCKMNTEDNFAFLKSTIVYDKNNVDFGLFGDSKIKNSNVKSINKVDSAPTTYAYSWIASDDTKNKNIITAYAIGTDTDKYDIQLVSDKLIASPVDASYLFSAVSFAGNVNLDWLNTSYTTNMSYMLYYAGLYSMTQLDLGNNFDTSNVTDMEGLFELTGMSSMTQLDLGDKFDTSNVIIMKGLFEFAGASSLTSLSLGDKFDTHNVTDMSYMFEELGYNKITSLSLGDSVTIDLNLGNKFNTINVTNMEEMFKDICLTSKTLSLPDTFNTSNVTNMKSMFFGSQIETLSLGLNFNTSNVTDMGTMFSSPDLVNLDLGDNFDTSKVTDMRGMFEYTSLKSLDLKDKFDVSKVTNMDQMFYYAGQLKTNVTYNLGPLFTSIASSHTNMFANSSSYLSFKVPSKIYSDSKHVKLNASSTTTIEVPGKVVSQ